MPGPSLLKNKKYLVQRVEEIIQDLKAYGRFQSQDHVKKGKQERKKGRQLEQPCMLDACLFVEIIKHRIFAFVDPL